MVQSTTSAYLAVATNIAAQQNATAGQADVKSATAYYLANIGKVTTVSQFVNNYQLFSYAMKAYGLEDMTYAKGLMIKVLNGGVTDSKALANTLSDPRYKAFATAFDFAGQGAKATQATSATSGASAKYIEQTLEDNQAKTNQGVANALYFKRNASSITSIYGLLADSTMLSVVETAYGISSTLGESDIDTQAAVLSKVVNLPDFKDPTKVEKLVERYTAAYDANGSSNTTNVLLADTSNTVGSILNAANGVSTSYAPNSVLNLFNSTSSSQNGVSSSLLLSLAKLSKGG
ncbi:DUF1217 domain-containing protein [Lichenibacterium dinghuense]|uniref:DUF1217 domain-containing protein n=1 Tax=Lichenibacterium dinghuense TaxID=2895977 RepID=UPI001F237E6B|nr:DUF1217 domain-containing protein [Lichenibacterium sp. 6Y81]